MTFQITGQQFLLPSTLSAPSITPLQADAGPAPSPASAANASPAAKDAQTNTVLQTLGLIAQTLSLVLQESLSPTPTGATATAAAPTQPAPTTSPNTLANAAIQRNTTKDPAQAQRLNNNLAAVANDPEGSVLLQKAIASGYTIEVGDPTAAAGGGGPKDADEVNGVTLPDQKKIVVNPNAPDFTKTLVHELVHAATDGDGDSKDEEGKADVIGFRVSSRILGQADPNEQLTYNNKVTNPAYASLAAANNVDQTLRALGISAFA